MCTTTSSSKVRYLPNPRYLSQLKWRKVGRRFFQWKPCCLLSGRCIPSLCTEELKQLRGCCISRCNGICAGDLLRYPAHKLAYTIQRPRGLLSGDTPMEFGDVLSVLILTAQNQIISLLSLFLLFFFFFFLSKILSLFSSSIVVTAAVVLS
jgi:hypothetical protein